ncbi:hypothetical protein [Halobacteriovorax sp. HLS]|uniref:hypothetical protein n=1 Tax=Halobacteriovorax sp. HLS TaxID=2234000 RepID=UPI000FD80E11|nr:hypothetical protein [Halobacteriovorax sp. HLS]
MQNDGIWLSILEYSQLKDISISTVRRYIKANRVKFKKENGKFIIFMNKENYIRYKSNNDEESEILAHKLKIQELELKNKALQLENDELKMLVQIYENTQSQTDLPELPVLI